MNPENKRVIIFDASLTGVGGLERLLLEVAKHLRRDGFETHVLTFDFQEEVLFNATYGVNIEQIGCPTRRKNPLVEAIDEIGNIVALRKKIREIKPDIMLLSNAWDCIYFYFATLFTPYSYMTLVPGTIFWFHDDLYKYALIHKKVFNEIRESVPGHKEFIPVKPPRSSLVKRVLKEFMALVMYKGVRKAEKIFVLSNQMKWEVNKLYGKDAIVLKGAFPRTILKYKPKQNMKQKLGLENKRMLLNVNRLESRKRVDLLIKAFKHVCEHFADANLIIGGIGEDEGRLKELARQLNLSDKVKFVGYIKEEDLWDYYASCDVFVHPNWAEFAIAPYEALALNKKVVWSTEMEIDEFLKGSNHVFAANPTVDDFARAIEKALTTKVTEKSDLSMYTWEHYCERLSQEIQGETSAGKEHSNRH